MKYYISVEKNKEGFEFYKKMWNKINIDGIMVETMTEGIQKAIEVEKSSNDILFFIDIVADDVDFLPQLKILNQETNAPILIATSKEHYTEKEHHAALNNGADFYAPYCEEPENDIEGVLSAINSANQRGVKKKSPHKIITHGDFLLDIDGYKVFIRDKELILANMEMEILKLLMLNIGNVLSHEQILERIYEGRQKESDSNNLYNAITRLRKKMRDLTGYDYVETIIKTGYRIITTKQDEQSKN